MTSTLAIRLGGISALPATSKSLVLKFDVMFGRHRSPKTVIMHLADSKTATWVIAICAVMKSMCDVFLYHAGDKEVEIQMAPKESEEQASQHAFSGSRE
jgi:hypothetical protein